MPGPTVQEADAFLSTTLYGDAWLTNSDEQKQKAINSAAMLLRCAYKGVAISNGNIYMQAAYMLTSDYMTISQRISSQSVSTSGVSRSFATSSRTVPGDLISPLVRACLGEPEKVEEISAGRVKTGRRW